MGTERKPATEEDNHRRWTRIFTRSKQRRKRKSRTICTIAGQRIGSQQQNFNRRRLGWHKLPHTRGFSASFRREIATEAGKEMLPRRASKAFSFAPIQKLY